MNDADSAVFSRFLQPMAGYLHLLLRSIAFSGRWLDPALQPGWYLAAVLFFSALVGNTCLSNRNPMACRYLLPAAIALIPHTGEVPLSLTNLQWIMALGLVVTSLKDDPSTGMEWASDVFFVVVIGLTGPFILFVVPFLLYRAYARRTYRSYILLGLAVAVSLIQLWYVYSTLAKSDGPPVIDAFKVFAVVSKRLFGSTLLGVASFEMREYASASLGVGMILYLSASIWALQKGRAVYALLLFYMLAIVFASGFIKRFDVWYFLDIVNGDRYFFIPKVVLVWIMIGIIARSSRPWAYLPSMVLISAGLALNIGTYRFTPFKDFKWYEACPHIRKFEQVWVVINPDWTFPYKRQAPILFPCFIKPPSPK